MKLTHYQIEHIKEFVHARGFKDLEVETEMLDHVASAVENELNQTPELTIDEALYNVHLSFGLFGFDHIETAVTQGIRQHIWRLFKTSFRKQWSISKHLIFNLSTASMMLLLFSGLQQVIPVLHFSLTLLLTIIFISLIPLIYHIKVFRNWKKRSMLTGRFLLPYAAAGFWIAYLLQLMPLQRWYDTPVMNGILIITSLWLSTNLLAGLSMVSETHKWTHERWLKYQS